MTTLRACLLAAACTSAGAGADVWQRADDSRFGFEPTFEGSPLPGEFRRFDVDLTFDVDAVESASLAVTVDLTAADLGDEQANAILADPIWFASAEHPRAVFTSTSIRATDDGYVADGELELKGATQALSVPFRWSRDGDAARMRGELDVKRTLFDVGSGEWSGGDAIGLDVKLSFDLRLARVE